MANASDKRRLAQNAAHIKRLQILVLVSNAVYFAARIALRARSSRAHAWGLAACAALQYGCYSQIAGALAPAYGAAGELVYAGADPGLKGGALSLAHDLLYIASFVEVAGAWTDRAWWAFFAVPGYAAYALYAHVLAPWAAAPPAPRPPPESEADRRRREKRERQEARAQKFAGRR